MVTLLYSNNNNRNRAEAAAASEQISTASTSTSTSSVVNVNGVNDDSAGGSQVDASGRLRSMFPTTEDTRRRQYWSQITESNDRTNEDKCSEEMVSNAFIGDRAVRGVEGEGGDRGGDVRGEGEIKRGEIMVQLDTSATRYIGPPY